MSGRHSSVLRDLLSARFSAEEIQVIETITYSGGIELEPFVNFDYSLGGPSALSITSSSGPGTLGIPGQGAGRYAIADREVFRPLQYCTAHLVMINPHAEWLTRDVVESSSSHIEALVKRIGRLPFLPLGAALMERSVKSVVPEPTYSQTKRFCKVYNAAKHDFDHDKDTHLFSLSDAIAAYFIARRLGLALYPLARLHTDMTVFDVEPATYDPRSGRLTGTAARAAD